MDVIMCLIVQSFGHGCFICEMYLVSVDRSGNQFNFDPQTLAAAEPVVAGRSAYAVHVNRD